MIGVVHLSHSTIVSIPVGFSSALQPPAFSVPNAVLDCFNPCRVFKCAATAGCPALLTDGSFCFNPCRVFKCAATKPIQLIMADAVSFNPCRVFKCAATDDADYDSSHNTQFQSLSGFQVRCNVMKQFPDNFIDLFQSLSGFQVRCNAEEVTSMTMTTYSFNPCRVFKCAAT